MEFTEEFGTWWNTLTEGQQDDVAHSVGLLTELGPSLGFPHSSTIKDSRHSGMRELRTQSGGRPLRTLYTFDPRRAAILLIGGDKTGDDRWYKRFVPMADRIYDEHLNELRKEGEGVNMRTRKFRELLDAMPAGRQRRIAERVKQTVGSMHLDELRKAHEMTQMKLAETLKVNQGEVSKIEHRTDLYVSTLAEYIHALGGELEIRAVFPEGDVRIIQFEQLIRTVRAESKKERKGKIVPRRRVVRQPA